MSILYSLRKYIDPEQIGVEDAEKRVEQQRPRDEQPGGPPPPTTQPPVAYACRVCGLESSEGAYCPECLADTMQPLTRRRSDGEPGDQ